MMNNNRRQSVARVRLSLPLILSFYRAMAMAISEDSSHPGARRRYRFRYNGNAPVSKEDTVMPKFMSSHSVPKGSIRREQVDQLARAAQDDPVIQPYRSFLNLSEGKLFCVMEAPDRETLSAWFKKMQMPCDSVIPVELEGERGTVKQA
jgi:hypothetical protein